MAKSIDEQANETIDSHVLWAMGAGAIPVPFLDMAAVTAIQLNMLKELCKIYEKDYSEAFGRSVITSLAGATLAKIGASFVKTIPVLGSLLGGVPMVILSGASTYAMGQVFKKHLEVEGVLNTFSFDNAKKVYEDAFEKGKEYVTVLQEQVGWKKKGEKANESTDAATVSTNGEVIAEKLRILADLKEKGILTEEEFRQKKEEILKQL
ncbi:MAG: DUF697 domain-containing protein [Cytophagales bacterium]|nr:MAG: DUF697 domain-containing protein [Cytophagales bacterium]